MSKKVLVISTSMRSKSNSEMLADHFMMGAKEAGHLVEKVTLKGKRISFCNGCLTCQKTGRCAISDDAVEIAEKMRNADVIVFSTPIYYYGMCGQMKTMLDRANALFALDYKFRDIYMLMTAADNEASVQEKTVNGIQGWIDCFEKAQLAGTVFAGGVTGPGEIAEHHALKEAYEMGKNI